MRTTGLTLIEMLVTLAVVSVVTAIAAPAFGRAVERATFNATARELASALRTTRHRAQSDQTDAVLVLDTGALRYSFPGGERDLRLPSDATLSMTVAELERTNITTGGIRFFADGSSTGGIVRLEHNRRHLAIEVSWLTGHVGFGR